MTPINSQKLEKEMRSMREQIEHEMRSEMECEIAKKTEEAYHNGYSDCEKKFSKETEDYEKLKKDYLLLQVKYDQVLRTLKEACCCLQYETGNGYIK